MTTTTTVPLTLFAFTPGPGSSIEDHERVVQVDDYRAGAIVRSFYRGDLAPIWEDLPLTDRRWLTDLGVTVENAVDGRTGVHRQHLEAYAPDLIG